MNPELRGDDIFNLVRNYAASTATDAIRLVPTNEPDDPKADRLGGRPFIPVGHAVPSHKGRPMQLLLQIDLAHIKPFVPMLGADGIFEVFSTMLSGQMHYETRLWPRDATPRDNVITPEKDPGIIVRRPCGLKVETFKDEMPYSDFRFWDGLRETIALKYPEVKNYASVEDFFEAAFGRHTDSKGKQIYWSDYLPPQVTADERITMFGYADFTQYDVREDDPKLKDRNVCLFKLDACGEPHLAIGDAGVLYGIITKKAVEQGNLEKVLCTWDCC